MSEHSLAYGPGRLPFSLPGEARVLSSKPAPGLSEPSKTILRSLEAPIGCKPLLDIARGKKNACIVISDITRPVPNDLILPEIIRVLNQSAIHNSQITILIGTGLHRPNEGSELEKLVGKEIAKNIRCVNHFGEDPRTNILAGTTRSGIPIWLDKTYLDADLKIVTGLIEPHLWAGYSGGRKGVLPGIAGVETMKHMHGFKMVAHDRCSYGVLEGNPFHQAGLEVAAMVGLDFLVNVTINEKREITGVFSGHYDLAHLEGVAFLEKFCLATVEERLDTAITCGGGEPLDRTLYQCVKGMSAARHVVKPGGRIIEAARCREGLGSKPFIELLASTQSPEELAGKLQSPGFFKVDQWIAQELSEIVSQYEVCSYSEGLDEAAMKSSWMRPVKDFQAFVRSETSGSTAVIPEGPYTLTQARP